VVAIAGHVVGIADGSSGSPVGGRNGLTAADKA
jgi:hypothetical protein